ncbi:prepilin-type N-terminal cleavage/methylation domain-containing protein [Vagococcus sp. BWB3-3]|uniref:Prepilin-type N-terminal cleavage/methylation domain-containing protein n=1 Tax=Vagococcus allomyrinae TaxID=2794353 RepID=A0A940PDW4_9ENTE|nr:prepilin-type N-terminal cleavage/methylation domain-containing protein [Vagococcus allomyrinae]MBP1042782.1 prepilin-type N-terminal cleavage/methylation domain-containing protein [Vagococcus allomyrinae]
MTGVIRLFRDEKGFSLIEIIVAVILLGSCFMLLATLVHQNSLAIQLTKRKEEAAFVREDIKEWLLYKGQIQDIAYLNNYVFVQIQQGKNLTDKQIARRGHLILDNTGIQRDGSLPVYGEVEVKEVDSKRGNFVRKVKYYPTEANFLPEKLRSEVNQLYIGEYLHGTKGTDFLVEIQVSTPETNASYNPRTEGVDLTILVYDKKNGSLLTSTVLNWVIDS